MFTIKNARLSSGTFATISVEDDRVSVVKDQKTLDKHAPSDRYLSDFPTKTKLAKGLVFDAKGDLILPAGIDSHVHSRDPGLSHKEDWKTLEKSAFKGGVVAVIDMPNTLPPTLTRKEIDEKSSLASKTQLAYKFFLGVSDSNLKLLRELLEDQTLPLAGLKVFYGSSTGGLMFSRLDDLDHALGDQDPMIVFHAEDQEIIDRNKSALKSPIQETKDPSSYAIHSKIRSASAAASAVRKILSWAERTTRRIHITHVSTAEEALMIHEAKSRGVLVTGEICPHHFLFSIDDYAKKGSLIIVNPPVRSLREVLDLRKCLQNGFFETFATDHAPHTREEKDQPYPKCPSGLPSLEFFYPLLFKVLLESNFSLESADTLGIVSYLGSLNPAQLFGFNDLGSIEPGKEASFTWLETKETFVTPKDIVSKCAWSPYDGMRLPHQVRGTWLKGKRVY